MIVTNADETQVQHCWINQNIKLSFALFEISNNKTLYKVHKSEKWLTLLSFVQWFRPEISEFQFE